MVLSDYELQRLDNIKRNEEVLRSLGLMEDNRLNPTRAKKQTNLPEPAPFVPESERRRSSRVSQTVVTFQALSDSFCKAEERHAERSNGLRKRGAPMTYRDEQQREVEFRENKARCRREAAARSAAEAARSAAEAAMMQNELAEQPVGGRQQTSALFTPSLPVVDDCAERPPHQYAYPTLSQRARCPRCHGLFVITAAGTLHKHVCHAV